MKALYHSPEWNGTIDHSALEGYLSLGYVVAPATIYKHVCKLEPGHWLLARKGHIQIGQYWDIENFDDHAEPSDELQSTVSDLIRNAVTDRLESEVPLGAFLSGGIDSGLVVSYMAEAMGRPVQTTSVGFGGLGHNELGAAALTAARWGTEQVSEVVEPQLDQVLDRVVSGFDEPFADASAIPTYYVSAIARRQVTVALSGDGGDEAFGGYSFRYVPHAVEAIVRQALPTSGRHAVGRLARHWPRSRRLPRALRWGTLLDNVSVDAPSAYFADLCITKPRTVRRILGLPATLDVRGSSVFDAVTAPYRHCASRSPIQRAEYADLKIYLANDVLVKVDRMSMAHSLEVRCPLLDHRLVELAFAIPRSRKMPWMQPKHLLKQIAQARLPAALLRLPKHGFSAPTGEWLAGPYRSTFIDEVLNSSSFVSRHLDEQSVRTLFDDHCRGTSDNSSVLWAIWMLERWNTLRERQDQPCPSLIVAG
jgi:asparagine synthase (glutamine-hydrolysing)